MGSRNEKLIRTVRPPAHWMIPLHRRRRVSADRLEERIHGSEPVDHEGDGGHDERYGPHLRDQQHTQRGGELVLAGEEQHLEESEGPDDGEEIEVESRILAREECVRAREPECGCEEEFDESQQPDGSALPSLQMFYASYQVAVHVQNSGTFFPSRLVSWMKSVLWVYRRTLSPFWNFVVRSGKMVVPSRMMAKMLTPCGTTTSP